MNLFDNFVRTEYEHAKYNEPDFSFLNRSARDNFERVRQLIENWFSHYPNCDKLQLQKGFRSKRNDQHRSAFFELFLHELFIKLDCNVIIHPTITGSSRKPDFLIETQSGNKTYIEAALVSSKSKEIASASARMKVVYDVINKLVDSTNFFLFLNIEGSPLTPPPARKIAQFINRKIGELDPDKIAKQYAQFGIDGLPTWQYEYKGWDIEIRPSPKNTESRGKKGVRPIGSMMTDYQLEKYTAAIRESVLDKANWYGEMDLPYIVAANAVDPIDEYVIMNALFGEEQLIYTTALSSPDILDRRIVRKPNGAWINHEGPRYTRVSAILMISMLSPWNIPRSNIRLYHNPWAQKPYRSVLQRLPQAIPDNGKMRFEDGDSLSDIFGLSPIWPENSS